MAKKYDVIVIGGGHNGLVNAAYLAKSGKKSWSSKSVTSSAAPPSPKKSSPALNFPSFPTSSRCFAQKSFAISISLATAWKFSRSTAP